jgi:hypothetical protein
MYLQILYAALAPEDGGSMFLRNVSDSPLPLGASTKEQDQHCQFDAFTLQVR